jgi:hypothetical protein
MSHTSIPINPNTITAAVMNKLPFPSHYTSQPPSSDHARSRTTKESQDSHHTASIQTIHQNFDFAGCFFRRSRLVEVGSLVMIVVSRHFLTFEDHPYSLDTLHAHVESGSRAFSECVLSLTLFWFQVVADEAVTRHLNKIPSYLCVS